MFMHFSCICTSLFFLLILLLIGTLLRLSLSLFLSDSLRMAPKRKSSPSRNPLCSEASSSSDSTPLHVRFYDEKPRTNYRRTFLDMAFIRNARSSFRISPILTYPLSLPIGVGSPFMTSWLAIPLWSCRSFTPTCTALITPYLTSSLMFALSVL